MHNGNDNNILIDIPTVSIGMPAFNGEGCIKQAIDSLLSQTFTDFELIISDNASSDGTEKICRAYASSDKRIRYFRQSQNMGAAANFKFVLEQAKADYFMWAAVDDVWRENFITACLAGLRNNPNAFACITNVLVDGKISSQLEAGILSLEGTIKEKILKFVRCPGGNSRFYSLYRTKELQKSFKIYNYLAGDFSNVIDFIKEGDFIITTDDYSFDKATGGQGSDIGRFHKQRYKKIEFIFPFYEFSIKVLKEYPSIKILLYLLRLNCIANIKRMLHPESNMIKFLRNIDRTIFFR
jgi:glycosyltransferase involved in cell wall biosynthesis